MTWNRRANPPGRREGRSEVVVGPLRALGVPRELAQGSLRLTVGIENMPEDIAYALDVLESCVSELRTTEVAKA